MQHGSLSATFIRAEKENILVARAGGKDSLQQAISTFPASIESRTYVILLF